MQLQHIVQKIVDWLSPLINLAIIEIQVHNLRTLNLQKKTSRCFKALLQLHRHFPLHSCLFARPNPPKFSKAKQPNHLHQHPKCLQQLWPVALRPLLAVRHAACHRAAQRPQRHGRPVRLWDVGAVAGRHGALEAFRRLVLGWCLHFKWKDGVLTGEMTLSKSVSQDVPSKNLMLTRVQ